MSRADKSREMAHKYELQRILGVIDSYAATGSYEHTFLDGETEYKISDWKPELEALGYVVTLEPKQIRQWAQDKHGKEINYLRTEMVTKISWN